MYYYDTGAVDADELREIEKADDFERCELDAVEMSSLKEVLAWIRESERVSSGQNPRSKRKGRGE